MSRPNGVKDSKPRKQMVTRGGSIVNRDGYSYRGADSGCEDATLLLKRQGNVSSSLCLECPFPEGEAPCWVGKKRSRKVKNDNLILIKKKGDRK